MTRSDLPGWVLLGSFVLWLPVAALPSRVWTTSLLERLALTAQRQAAIARMGNALAADAASPLRGRWGGVAPDLAVTATGRQRGDASATSPGVGSPGDAG